MSTEQGRAWTQIASSIIVGGAAVLAAMVPLYCAKQNKLEQAVNQTQTADSENASLKQTIATLESQIQEKDALIKTLRNASSGGTVPGPGPTPESTPVITPREIIDHDFKFHLNGCSLAGTTVHCDFLVTNQLGDRRLDLRSESRVVSDSADEYPATGFTLGATSGPGGVNPTIPGGVSLKARIDFEGVRHGTKKLVLMEIYCYTWLANGDREEFILKFNDIDL